ncbi:hypothetical protein DFJ74DRAFT_345764 [Hyaloraphidium curvatum]|nr:hypothetical protein DFJ74DRAFT_345764 [Hyaloraphidium curvatum]
MRPDRGAVPGPLTQKQFVPRPSALHSDASAPMVAGIVRRTLAGEVAWAAADDAGVVPGLWSPFSDEDDTLGDSDDSLDSGSESGWSGSSASDPGSPLLLPVARHGGVRLDELGFGDGPRARLVAELMEHSEIVFPVFDRNHFYRRATANPIAFYPALIAAVRVAHDSRDPAFSNRRRVARIEKALYARLEVELLAFGASGRVPTKDHIGGLVLLIVWAGINGMLEFGGKAVFLALQWVQRTGLAHEASQPWSKLLCHHLKVRSVSEARKLILSPAEKAELRDKWAEWATGPRICEMLAILAGVKRDFKREAGRDNAPELRITPCRTPPARNEVLLSLNPFWDARFASDTPLSSEINGWIYLTPDDPRRIAAVSQLPLWVLGVRGGLQFLYHATRVKTDAFLRQVLAAGLKSPAELDSYDVDFRIPPLELHALRTERAAITSVLDDIYRAFPVPLVALWDSSRPCTRNLAHECINALETAHSFHGAFAAGAFYLGLLALLRVELRTCLGLRMMEEGVERGAAGPMWQIGAKVGKELAAVGLEGTVHGATKFVRDLFELNPLLEKCVPTMAPLVFRLVGCMRSFPSEALPDADLPFPIRRRCATSPSVTSSTTTTSPSRTPARPSTPPWTRTSSTSAPTCSA